MELASLCTAPLRAINGLSRLTKLTTSKGQTRPIRFENFRIGQSQSNRIGRPIRIRIESRSFAGPTATSMRLFSSAVRTVNKTRYSLDLHTASVLVRPRDW